MKNDNIFKALKEAEAMIKKLKDLIALPEEFRNFVNLTNKQIGDLKAHLKVTATDTLFIV